MINLITTYESINTSLPLSVSKHHLKAHFNEIENHNRFFSLNKYTTEKLSAITSLCMPMEFDKNELYN